MLLKMERFSVKLSVWAMYKREIYLQTTEAAARFTDNWSVEVNNLLLAVVDDGQLKSAKVTQTATGLFGSQKQLLTIGIDDDVLVSCFTPGYCYVNKSRKGIINLIICNENMQMFFAAFSPIPSNNSTFW
jgi:hypothetical protein